MADTIQVVMWALGQKCPLRIGDDWQSPATALNTLSDYRTYSELRKRKDRGFGIFGDVCVHSVTPVLTGNSQGPYYDYPVCGFVLSSQFSAVGGLPSLHRLCGGCPANGDAGGLAGCAGAFHQELYSDALQEQLERVIDGLGLKDRLDSLFPRTERQWFRFWIASLIPAEAARGLHQLLEAVYEEDERAIKDSGRSGDGDHSDLRAFISALDRSVKSGIPIHVTLTPPGHTDLGWCTTFPHCPRCKAAAPVKLWQRKYPDEVMPCAICGQPFSPARTHSAVRDERERNELREVLGQTEFEKLAKQHLMAQDASDSEAERIVQVQEEIERKRSEEGRLRVEASQRHDRFVADVIYLGLRNLSCGAKDKWQWLFSPADAEEVLRRCKEHGGKVRSIFHVSESGEQDEFVQVSWPTSAARALRKLRKKGCNEKFTIWVQIPTEKVEKWCAEKH